MHLSCLFFPQKQSFSHKNSSFWFVHFSAETRENRTALLTWYLQSCSVSRRLRLKKKIPSNHPLLSLNLFWCTCNIRMKMLCFFPLNVFVCVQTFGLHLGLILTSLQQLWLSSSLPSRQSSSPSHFHKARMQRWLWHWNSSLLHRCGSKAPLEASVGRQGNGGETKLTRDFLWNIRLGKKKLLAQL